MLKGGNSNQLNRCQHDVYTIQGLGFGHKAKGCQIALQGPNLSTEPFSVAHIVYAEHFNLQLYFHVYFSV